MVKALDNRHVGEREKQGLLAPMKADIVGQ
jgi:hypothetical protein